jgi:hypothetical protein
MHYNLQAPGSDLIDLYIRIYRALDFEFVRYALTHLQRPLQAQFGCCIAGPAMPAHYGQSLGSH